MAMIDPPIDMLVLKAGSKYSLCSGVTKRAKELILKRPDFFMENYRVKPLEVATDEFANDVFKIVKK